MDQVMNVERPAVGLSGVERHVMPDGYLPAFDGSPVLASCDNCSHCMDQSEGPEYGPSWYACEKPGREHMSNLKGFPFKTAQRCCELHIAHCVDWDAEAMKFDASLQTQ